MRDILEHDGAKWLGVDGVVTLQRLRPAGLQQREAWAMEHAYSYIACLYIVRIYTEPLMRHQVVEKSMNHAQSQ